jgi:predicted acetyltransferase
VWRTTEAWEALISFLAAQDPLVFEIRHSTPRGELLHPYLRSSYVRAEVEPEFMLRLVDVEGALRLLDRTVERPLVLEVTDDVVQDNAGSYTVGDGEVVRGVEAEERVTLDVRQLAQLHAGYLPARQLARHGLVEPSSQETLELLEALFPVDDPWVYPPDHF